ncbi:protein DETOXIFICATION 19-like [Chenopodium quinoa]|uniref:protein DETOXIFICATION 19-like n=1 Tax=Chenopodium quinoa TaxID=63459 RepID=UPI000B778DA9|nr:protein DETOXIFICATION 19-like [Chenopodium quinoa]
MVHPDVVQVNQKGRRDYKVSIYNKTNWEIGLSGALETLCGQVFGAKLYKMLGIYLQASFMISIIFSIIISTIWWFTEPILNILLHQNSNISKEAAVYMRFLIPGIFAFGLLQNILRFLQAQSVVLPLVTFSLVPLLLHCVLNYIMVHFTTLGYTGAALATSLTFWLSLITLVIYVSFAKKFEHSWRGLSKESFHHVFVYLKLALPSAAMVCVNTETIAYMVTYGLNAAASTRVSNELGGGKANQAKHAMGVTLKLSILLAAFVVLVLGLGHDIWAGFFIGNASIIKAFASLTPLLCISIFLDSIQGILSGVCRGCGWQHLVMYINLGTFYLIGMPVAYLVAFKLQMYVKGLWIGLICGLVLQSSLLFLITRLRKWMDII